MTLAAFMYRRLARWVTMEVAPWPGAHLAIKSKHELASFQDVFCQPFYWQALQSLQAPPRLVVDCGANCGHFTILAQSCMLQRFRTSSARFVIVEPNPRLRSVIDRNLASTGLRDRVDVIQALVGERHGQSDFWVHPQYFLAASTQRQSGAKRYTIPFVDLDLVTAGSRIDLLKLDIEGSEYSFVQSYPDLLRRVGLLVAELHARDGERDAHFISQLERSGLSLVNEPVAMSGNLLVAFVRKSG